MSSFFTLPTSQRKRRKVEAQSKGPPQNGRSSGRRDGPKRRKERRSESVSSGDSDEGLGDLESRGSNTEDRMEHDDPTETPADRRLRLAEEYLQSIRDEVNLPDDEEVDEEDLVASRLKDDAARSKGLMYRRVAQNLDLSNATATFFRANSDCVTSIAARLPFVYTASKDIRLTKWKLQDSASSSELNGTRTKGKPSPPSRRRPTKIISRRGSHSRAGDSSYQNHVAAILCVAASPDGNFVASGGADKRLIVWSAENLSALRVFNQHRDAVTGLVFRLGTNQLFSSSADRTIKAWSLDELAYTETLFGHQDHVVDIAALASERCLSVGARDRTARLWKIVEETQLVYRRGAVAGERGTQGDGDDEHAAGPEGSIDRATFVDEQVFVTGSDNGSLVLWNSQKKKPLFVLPAAHGFDDEHSSNNNKNNGGLSNRETLQTEQELSDEPKLEPSPRWITALRALPYSDLVLSGSWDGRIKAWKISDDKKKIEALGVLGEASRGDNEEIFASLATNGLKTSRHQGFVNNIEIVETGAGSGQYYVFAAVGTEHRLGRWRKVNGRNGAVAFSLQRKA